MKLPQDELKLWLMKLDERAVTDEVLVHEEKGDAHPKQEAPLGCQNAYSVILDDFADVQNQLQSTTHPTKLIHLGPAVDSDSARAPPPGSHRRSKATAANDACAVGLTAESGDELASLCTHSATLVCEEVTRRETSFTEVEETLKRIQSHKGVIGTMVVNAEGIPIRTTLDNSTTVQYAGLLHQLMIKAKSTIRDIDPQNDLTFLRIRSKKHEIMVAPDKEYLLIVIQNPCE
ncbi:hypothetical protein H920_17383 [Fukomys damarensis]|uniref:Roadblock/LAMTOR2 domain-containing protein n=1 Tax=Fukomys damarensis TaxID=885580 RepID=A0A091DEL9_FUKDA|nr:hypothetical protein H920_17383 [Fukomys damarensis]